MGNFLLRFLNDGFSQHATFAYSTFSDWFYYFFILLKNLQKLYKIPQKKDGARLPRTTDCPDHPQIRPASMIFEYPNCIPFYDYNLW